ncbi:MAG: hypothetical protein ACRDMY_07615 [Gaiellaceae bacterium]
MSRAYADAGFRDSYREVHPDPVAVPGFTWTPGGPEAIRREVHDRIDWVLASGNARAVASDLVGERGGPDVDIAVRPYPSDHRGVASTFVVRPGEPEFFAAPETRSLSIGDTLSVVFHGTGRAGERVAIAATTTLSRASEGPWPLRPGTYEVRLLLDDGYSSRAKSHRFRIVRRSAE